MGVGAGDGATEVLQRALRVDSFTRTNHNWFGAASANKAGLFGESLGHEALAFANALDLDSDGFYCFFRRLHAGGDLRWERHCHFCALAPDSARVGDDEREDQRKRQQ